MEYKLIECGVAPLEARKYLYAIGAFHFKCDKRSVFLFNRKLHNENGPADIWYAKDGSIGIAHYYLNNFKHNENGPAVTWHDISGNVFREEYWLKGIEYLKDEYLQQIQIKLYW